MEASASSPSARFVRCPASAFGRPRASGPPSPWTQERSSVTSPPSASMSRLAPVLRSRSVRADERKMRPDEIDVVRAADDRGPLPPGITPSDAARLPRGRRILWSLSWPTVVMVLCIAVFFAGVVVVGVVTNYQRMRNAPALGEDPLVSTVVTLHVWRAMGFLVPMVAVIVLYLLAAWCVVAQHRKSSVSARRWRRVVVDLAAISLVAIGLGIVAGSLVSPVTYTPDAWVVRAAGVVIGLVVAGSAAGPRSSRRRSVLRSGGGRSDW